MNQRELRRKIKQAAREGWTELSLSNERLTTLLAQIGNLTRLTKLDLARNKVTSLPPEIGNLTALKELALWFNQLTSLPREIGKLIALTKLDLARNKVTSLPPEIGILTALKELALWLNQLTSLPPEIGKLTALTKLDLARNKVTSLPPEIGNLTRLAKLSLLYNQLTSLPPEIGKLTALTELSLYRNALTFLPSEIGNLAVLKILDLGGNQLTSLPPEIGNLIGLTKLALWGNQLTSVPSEIGNLASLILLGLGANQLSSLPPEIGKLTRLTKLDFARNKLTSLPPEIGNLTVLKELYLNNNQLTSLPPEIGNLSGLTKLDLEKNRLTSLPPNIGNLTDLPELDLSNNQLTSLPPEIGKLTGLRTLHLWSNQLTSLPPDIGNLTTLTILDLHSNQLASLPLEIGKLTALTKLDLGGNPLAPLPLEIGKLTALEELYLNNNQLTSLPPEIGKLTALTALYLGGNQLTSLPPGIGKLTALTELDLRKNKLTSLPSEIGNLTDLTELNLRGNPDLSFPPPEVVSQGTRAVLAYLGAILRDPARGRKWEAKLLIVGEAGVGKTELVKSLYGDQFGGETTTKGVSVRSLRVNHPSEAKVKMRLHLWDFGGQEIQLATHQFFYSQRALFVLVWNARENYAQAKLNDWLELIQARASELPDPTRPAEEAWKAPVLLVATHCDLWRPDIPLENLKAQFPRIRFLGLLPISNKPPRTGIEELRTSLVQFAAALPVMGISWPQSWQGVEDALAKLVKDEKSRITLGNLWEIMDSAGVEESNRQLLARSLDSVGKIRVFLEDEELRDTVLLAPQWLTSRIARVLQNQDSKGKEVCQYAVLRREEWFVFWAEENERTRRLFVRMMRKFDLVYELDDVPQGCLVVQLLPFELNQRGTGRYSALWRKFETQPEISMRFRLEQSIPPGIPSWFIAREHRFSLDLHWRLGVLLADDPRNPKHLGRVEAFPERRYVDLTVRGPMPRDFFALLRDGLEFTLGRYPGLVVRRLIPCPGRGEKGCLHEHDFDLLVQRLEKQPDRYMVECPVEVAEHDSRTMLYGLAPSTMEAVAATLERNIAERIETSGVGIAGRIKETKQTLSIQLREIMEHIEDVRLVQRYFLKEFQHSQTQQDDACPNVFVLRCVGLAPGISGKYGDRMELHLCCQEPGEWHPTFEGGKYVIEDPSKCLVSLAPYLQKMFTFLKFTPVLNFGTATEASELEKFIKEDVRLMGEIIRKLRQLPETEQLRLWGEGAKEHPDRARMAEGSELRALRVMLDHLDPAHDWGGLRKVHTPEGHYLWLCRFHAAKYLDT